MDACIRYVQETFGEGFVQDKSAKELFKTVKVYLENNLNVSEASRMLYIHRNTLMYRLEKFNKMTGLECSKFDVGMRIGIALLILQFIENKEPALLNKI
jgi:carbohydrate diacid regulator